MLKLSLIIPVYNEERHIKACLDAIAAQSVMPDEVIVVDNNCTDRTIEKAKEYDFVTVITEKNQGRGYARSAGFNAAKNEILGRIDADSRLTTNWVEHVKQRFSADENLAGITGLGITTFLPGIMQLKTKFITRGYFWHVHSGFRTITMWGANMAIRSSVWYKVKNDVILDDSQVHEDQDISLWITATGGKIIHDNAMLVFADGQAYMGLKKVLYYRSLYHKTKALHTNNGNLSKSRRLPFNLIRTLLGYFVMYVIGGVVLALGMISSPFRSK